MSYDAGHTSYGANLMSGSGSVEVRQMKMIDRQIRVFKTILAGKSSVSNKKHLIFKTDFIQYKKSSSALQLSKFKWEMSVENDRIKVD